MVLAPTLGLLADSTTMPIPALLTAAVAGADETDPSNTADEPEEERLVAPVVEPATDQIMPLDFVLYKVYRTPDGYAGLVSGGMDISEEQLPARFEVAVPAGVELLWFGEIHGGDRENDPAFPEPFEMRTEGDFDIYTAVTTVPVMQIEFLLGYTATELMRNGNHSIHLEYTPLHNARTLRLATYIPDGSTVLDAPLLENLGLSPHLHEYIYARTFSNVAGGRAYEITIEYQPSAAAARHGTADLEMGIVVVAVTVIGTLFLAAGLMLLVRHRRNQAESYDDTDYDTYYGENNDEGTDDVDDSTEDREESSDDE